MLDMLHGDILHHILDVDMTKDNLLKITRNKQQFTIYPYTNPQTIDHISCMFELERKLTSYSFMSKSVLI